MRESFAFLLLVACVNLSLKLDCLFLPVRSPSPYRPRALNHLYSVGSQQELQASLAVVVVAAAATAAAVVVVVVAAVVVAAVAVVVAVVIVEY